MRRLAGATLGLLAACIASSPAAGLSLVSQARTVHAKAQFTPFFEPPNPVDEHSLSASDFGPFVASVDAHVTSASIGVADSSASQDSSIEQPLPSTLHTEMTGGVNAFAANRNVPIDTLSQSDSEYLLTFELAEAARYVLHAALGVSESSTDFAFGAGRVVVELLGDGSVVIERRVLDTSSDGSFQDVLDASGTLAPGSYSLHVLASAQAFAARYFGTTLETDSSGGATYQVDLQVVPEPSTALLLASCLLGLARGRRQRGRRPAEPLLCRSGPAGR